MDVKLLYTTTVNHNFTSGLNTTSIHLNWILACQIWAIFLSFVGTLGNSVTLIVFVCQLYLHRRRRWRRSNPLRPTDNPHNPNRTPFNSSNRSQSVLSLRVVESHSRIKLSSYILLLVHLSFCDFLYCAINLPLTTYTYTYAYTPDSVPPQSFCTVAALLRYVIASLEWMTLGLLTFKRCIDINRTRDAHLLKPKTTCILIVCTWVANCLFHALPALNGHFGYISETYKCSTTNRIMKYFFFIGESALPCGFMLIGCFSLIFKVWRNVERLRKNGFPKEMVQQRFRNLIRSTALLMSLLLLFLCCVIPVCTFNVHMLITGIVNLPLGIGLYMTYWVQYAVNFLVYAASNKFYRDTCKESFAFLKEGLCCWWRHPRTPQLQDGVCRQGVGNAIRQVPKITISVVSDAPSVCSKCGMNAGFASDSNLLKLASSSCAGEERSRSVSESSLHSSSAVSCSGLSNFSTDTVHTSLSLDQIHL